MKKLEFKHLLNLNVPLLLLGETGTGKSHLARQIFNQSQIFKQRFLTAHLASLKEDIIESELFGHTKGAFTGAVETKYGYLQEVGQGTLFLDEIGELSLEAQKKLLYLLEEKKFSPVGSVKEIDFKGRLIMATNVNLEELVEKKLFRKDLYFRIKTFSYTLLSLREKKEELAFLIENSLEEMNIKYHKKIMLSPSAKNVLLNAPWPGNVRELKHSLEFAVALAESRTLEINDFHFVSEKMEKTLCGPAEIAQYPTNFNQSFELFERSFLEHQLKLNQGKINQTARVIGMSKTGLIQKAKKYGIDTFQMRYLDHLKSA